MLTNITGDIEVASVNLNQVTIRQRTHLGCHRFVDAKLYRRNYTPYTLYLTYWQVNKHM